jgi:hypothetical protein
VKARRFMPVASLVALLVLAVGAAVGVGSGANAQAEVELHPAHIHTGQCGATLGDVVYPLTDVGAGMGGSPVAGSTVGSTSAIPVQVSITTVQTDLASVADGNHAINVHESAENIGNYIACGDIGGTQMGSDLAFGLAELNNSGYSGVAWLHDNGDGTITVAVFLTEEYAAPGTPTAS